MKLALALGAWLAAAGSAQTAFEGTVEMRMSIAGRDGYERRQDQKLQISSLGLRTDSTENGRTVGILRLRATPETTFFVDDDEKSYREKEVEPHSTPPRQTFTLKESSAARLRGYRCKHFVFQSSDGSRIDEWVTTDVRGLEHWASTLQRDFPSAAPLGMGVKGADGLPIKIAVRAKNGNTITWEVTRVRRQRLPPELFDLKGYRLETQPERD